MILINNSIIFYDYNMSIYKNVDDTGFIQLNHMLLFQYMTSFQNPSNYSIFL